MPPPPPVPDRTETLAPRSRGTEATEPAPPRPAPPPSGLIDDPDRYEQVGEHARGGLGRVVRAVDKRLGRTVAVKELLRHDGSQEARFLREAMITARLEHPGIVPVHEAGRWPNGDPYYVMKLVEGRTLKELICERPALRDRIALLPHVIAIADAVGYAHSEGVIHRDLKPSNVIVGEFGETIVVDWGLARDRKRDLPEPALEHLVYTCAAGASTVSGKVVGTPSYMSPEQARGELVDERADVYAIGTVLYELLAGAPPHHDETPQATLERVISGPPRPLTSIAPQVPSELATIVAKAMARCPEDRYANASLLAEDLRRFHTGKLVSAHSYTAWSLLRKKLAQHRGVVAVGVASVIALGAIGVESFRRVVAERNIAQYERARAVDSQLQTERRQREMVLLQAETSLPEDPTATIAWLKDYRIADEDRAHVLGLVDEAISLGVARHVFRPGDWAHDAAFTPDGQTIVAAVRDGVIRAYDVRTGAERRLGRSESTPELVVMSPDGRFALTAGTLGDVMVWPLDGAPPRMLTRGSRLRASRLTPSLKLSADATRVLVLHDTGAPRVFPIEGGASTTLGSPTTRPMVVADSDWSRRLVVESLNQVLAIDGDRERVLATTAKAIERIVMSPRGEQVVLHDGETVWIVPFEGGPLRKLTDYPGRIVQVVWSPDGQTIALGGDLHDLKLVDAATGATRDLRGHTDANYTLQWSRDGRRLLSASDDSTVRVWTVSDGSAIELRGHQDDVYRARFSLDETWVVSSSLDSTIRVWHLDQPGARMLVEGDEVRELRLDGDRALVRTSKEVAWWNLTSGHRVPVFSWAKERGLGHARQSPDGEHLFVPNADGSAELRHRSRPTMILRGHTAPIDGAEFSRDGRYLYTSSRDQTLRRWDTATGESRRVIDGGQTIQHFAVAADGRVAVLVGSALELIAPDGAVRVLGTGPAWTARLGFERVKDRLLLRRYDESLAMLDGDRLIELPTDGRLLAALSVSPDGQRIAGALADRTVRVWDAGTGQVRYTLRGHSDLVMDVAFSPDGRYLASSSYDKTVRVWQPEANRFRVLRGHAAPVDQIEWGTAQQIVTGSRDGTLRIWDVPSLELPPAAELAGRLRDATTAVIDADRPTTGAAQPHGSDRSALATPRARDPQPPPG